MKQYCSFLVFHPKHKSIVEQQCSQAGWDVEFITDPSRRFRFSENTFFELTNPNAGGTFDIAQVGESYGDLLMINAGESDANNIVQLIWSAHIIMSGFHNQKWQLPTAFPIPEDTSDRESLFENVFRRSGYFEHFRFDDEMPVAVALAARAWGDRRIIYAIHKLAQSYTTECITPWSTHPERGQVFEKHSDFHSDHVTTSIAVNLAYSAIEELDLKIKSHGGKPRWLDNKKFVWNPEVLDDIKKRLAESKINPDMTIDWIQRGEPTEHLIEPQRTSTADYGSSDDIRDMRFSIPDAISACGYLRDKTTAHAFCEGKTDLLGPYEVYNVQQTVRLLIIHRCGLWNTWTSDLATSVSKESLE